MEAVELAKEAEDYISKSIPPMYLVKCKWMVPFQSDSLASIQGTIKDNAVLFRDCFIRHNGLIEVLEASK